MKQDIIKSASTLLRRRSSVVPLFLILVATISTVVYAVLHIEPGELKIVVQYTGFGETHFYREYWYYLLNFVFFYMALVLIHVLIAVKLHATKGFDIAVGFLWLTLALLIISGLMVFELLEVAAL